MDLRYIFIYFIKFSKNFFKNNYFFLLYKFFYIIQKYQSNNEILIFWTNGISKIQT